MTRSQLPGTAGRRLLYVITDPGSSILLKGQLRWMVQAGFEVHLASGPPASRHDFASSESDTLNEFARSERVTAHELPLVRDPRLGRDLRALFAMLALLRTLRPTIVNASTPKAGMIGIAAAWLCRVPVRVHVVRGLRLEGVTGPRRLVLSATHRLSIRLATHVLFNSHSLHRLAVAEGLIKPREGRVPASGSGNGIDMSRFQGQPSRVEARRAIGLPEDALVVGFVGRLTRDKGVVDLVRAFDQLAATRPSARLLLIGGFEQGDPVPPATRARIESDSRICNMGWVKEPMNVYPAMDVLAFPSYREGLPNVPLEAQASGIPVAGYAATGTVDAVRHGETGVLVPVGAVEELAAATGALLDDPARTRSMGANGREWVSRTFRAERVWAELEELYRESIA